MNKYDVSTNVLNTYFSASKTLMEKIGAPSGAPLLRLRVCKHNKGETYINFCKGVIGVSFSTMLEFKITYCVQDLEGIQKINT